MDYKFPDSMDELIYFTNRSLDSSKGFVKAWAYKVKCPKCGKSLLSKPVDPKTKRFKIRSSYYECPSCKYTIEKVDLEPSLSLEVVYKCPKCSNQSYVKMPFKRKSYQGAKAFVFDCDKCGYTIAITQKMKSLKNKKGKTVKVLDEDDD